MLIEFKYPYLLLLLFPVGFILYLYGKQLKNKAKKIEGSLILLLRSMLFICIVFSLAIPQLLLPIKSVPVVFLIDRSASVKASGDDELKWLEDSVDTKKEQDEFSVISFGGEPIIEQMMGSESIRFLKWNNEIQEENTDMETAISMGASLLSGENGGRLVLLTDGNETRGQAKNIVQLLKNRSIELDAFLLQSDHYEDAAISEIALPPTLYEGEKAAISVIIDSNTNNNGVLRLFANNKEVATNKIQINEGKTNIPLSIEMEQTGLVTFRAEIETTKDAYAENNKLQAVSTIKTTPKILIVQNDHNVSIQNILKNAGYKVDVYSTDKLPTALSGYLNYQTIIFNNVSATSITENQMKLMETSVKDFGVGFIMAGGDESFGLGGYFKTPIEKLLPVDMDIKGKKEMPSLGLMIVLDRSGSMDGSKLNLAKEAAARSVELLRESDTLGFIAFDDKPWVIVEPEPLKNKEEVVDKIRSIQPGGGTEIYSSLETAYSKIEDLNVKRKHIILLTDGQSATNNDYNQLIEDGKTKNITLSTVALGADADRQLLEELAATGSGRYYEVQDSTVIPSILSRETVMATRTYIEDNPFYPIIQQQDGWDSLFQSGVPQMNAYIATTAKSQAQISIVSEKEDPILASWQYGLGKTIAYTSDLNGAWAGDWARWSNWSNFVSKMVDQTLPKYNSEAYSFSSSRENDQYSLIADSNNMSMMPIEATIVSDEGEEINVNTKLSAPGKYKISMPDNPGMYFIQIKTTDEDGGTSTYQTGFSIPYSSEYLVSGNNKEWVSDLLSATNGKLLTKEKDAFRPLSESNFTKQDITVWLLLLAFFLFFIEIAIRRFGIPYKLVSNISRTVENRKVEKENKQIKNSPKKKTDRPLRETKPTEKQAIYPLQKEDRIVKHKDKDKKEKNQEKQSDNHLDQLLQMKRKKRK